MINRRSFSAAVAIATLPFAAQAGTYPNQPVRAIVSNAPGTDTTARFLANQMGKQWGVSVFVENKVGAGVIPGTDLAAKTAPDGHNILFTTGAHFSFPAPRDKLAFDANADFTPVASFAQAPIVMYVPADSPLKAVHDGIDAAMKATDSVSYSSPGAGTSSHLAAVTMGTQAGIRMLHVPYKSASQAELEVASGQTQVGFNEAGVTLPLLQAGRIRTLAVSSLKRSASVPQVPTLDELVLKGYDSVTPILALVRTGTTAPIVEAFGAAMMAAAAAAVPEFGELCKAHELDVAIQGPAGMKDSAPKEFDKWRRLVEMAAVKAPS